jgi:arginine decarboxylase
MSDFKRGLWRDLKRKQNQRKADRDAARGPVTHDPDTMPIGEAIEDFHRRNDLSFGIPAHRSGTGGDLSHASRWAGEKAFNADIGMNKGVDNRHQSWQVEPTAMQLFAEAVGADETMFSTNGSTENVHVAMMAAVRPGEKLVMARNGHKSAFSGLVLSGALPVYVEPDYDDRWQLAHGVAPGALDHMLRDHPDAVASMAFTPTYYGVSADVEALARVAHAHDVPLITDDAWGLDYSFCTRLPKSAIESGADLAIGSVHKTLDAFTQTSVLSRKGERIDPQRLSLVFELAQSTSASALLISSIDAARNRFQHHGEELLGRAIDHALRVRDQITSLDGLDLMGEEVLDSAGAHAFDPTHITFDVLGLGLTGYQAWDWLQEHHGLHLELADHRRLMALITFADTDATTGRLCLALNALVEEHRGNERLELPHLPGSREIRMDTVLSPRQAFLGRTEMVPWRKASGRISAEMVCPYPPGIPIVAPGELLTDAAVDYLEELAAQGVMVEGATDESLAEFRVVA